MLLCRTCGSPSPNGVCSIHGNNAVDASAGFAIGSTNILPPGITIYWAAPLFKQAERYWNRACAKLLTERGYKVILPQDEAKPFVTPKGIDAKALAENCYKQATDSGCDVVMVAVLDGADSDSGTSVEFGLRIGYMRALGKKPKVVGARTDFRVSEDEHLNAMFRLADDHVYLPSFDEDPAHLVNLIDEKIRRLV